MGLGNFHWFHSEVGLCVTRLEFFRSPVSRLETPHSRVWSYKLVCSLMTIVDKGLFAQLFFSCIFSSAFDDLGRNFMELERSMIM